jgi:2-polyprenyl-3-methyl-5-hydroxy-6-metoxy-1,4-benzoquinol methylase
MSEQLKNVFNNIYENGKWNNGLRSVPLSGPGSSLETAKNFLLFIDKFIEDNNIKSVIDTGCGDLTWISKSNFFNNDNFNYLGIDISDYIININKEKYPNKNFQVNNVIENFSNCGDLIIIRDVIFHLSNNDILNVFKNIKNKFKYICVTNCRNDINLDNFDRWHYSKKNIFQEPFNVNKNYLYKIEENMFDRDILLFEHDLFYQFNNQ